MKLNLYMFSFIINNKKLTRLRGVDIPFKNDILCPSTRGLDWDCFLQRMKFENIDNKELLLCFLVFLVKIYDYFGTSAGLTNQMAEGLFKT